jgi:oxalate decarboxylase
MKLSPKQPFDAWVEIIREMMRPNLSRRAMLAAGGFAALTAAAHAAVGLGNPDLPPEGAVNVTNPEALTDPGPQDPGLAGHEPSFLNPPATDVNGMPQFWASFSLAPKRIQNGGWARQITRDDFHISTTSRALTCAWARAAFANSTGINRPSGPS